MTGIGPVSVLLCTPKHHDVFYAEAGVCGLLLGNRRIPLKILYQKPR